MKAVKINKKRDLKLKERICKTMVKILFVCHGNICRSPMAEFVMKDLVCQNGYKDKFYINSKATSTEELGNGPHYGTLRKLREVGIPIEHHIATQMKKSDYNDYDYIIGMDNWNYKNIMRIIGQDPYGKVSLLLEFEGSTKDIADPWYTGNFDKTYDDVLRGCKALLEHLVSEGKL